MPAEITQHLFTSYVQGTATPAESDAVRAWLAQPANQLLAQHWMRQHWETLAELPAQPLADEPAYEDLLVGLHEQLGFRREELPVAAPWWRRWAAAAAVALTVGAGGWLLYSQRALTPQELATDYGQTRTVRLPDGSEVTLNGHSKLHYAPKWTSEGPREVWLEGEAYFSVKHQPNHQRFVVHTQAGFNVEVLGTKFTVYRRREQARVVLLSGKVRIDFEDRTRKDVILKPGELVETRDAQPATVVHKAVRTAPYASWKDAQLVLDETSIGDLATRLQDTYGITVEVRTPGLTERKVTGTMPVGDLDVLLQALEEAFDLQATREGNRITLADKAKPTP